MKYQSGCLIGEVNLRNSSGSTLGMLKKINNPPTSKTQSPTKPYKIRYLVQKIIYKSFNLDKT